MYGVIDHLVSYADTDAASVAFHGRYVEWAERSRLCALHEAGLTATGLASQHGLELVVRSMTVQYRQPALLEQWLRIGTRLHCLGDVRFTLRSHIERKGVLLATVDAELVVLRHRVPYPVPELLSRALLKLGDATPEV